MVSANVNAPHGNHIQMAIIFVYMKDIVKLEGVTNMIHTASRMDPGDSLTMHVTVVMRISPPVDPEDLQHSNVVPAKGKGPPG